MMYAFSRDGAIPGSKFLHRVDRRWRSPIRTGSSSHRYFARRIGNAEDILFSFVLVWLACTLSFILGLPSLGSSVAFSAATSIATIGLYISYGTQNSLNALPLCTNHSYHSQGSQSPCASSTRIDSYEDRSISASSRIQ